MAHYGQMNARPRLVHDLATPILQALALVGPTTVTLDTEE
jgi:hypothetical protein